MGCSQAASRHVEAQFGHNQSGLVTTKCDDRRIEMSALGQERTFDKEWTLRSEFEP